MTGHPRRPRVVALHGRGNLYNDGVYRAMETLGIEVMEGVFAGRWLWANLRRGDIADIHWPSFFYPSRGPRGRQVVGYLRFVLMLLLIRLRGARIVWTAHNLFPHDRADPPVLDTLGRHLVIGLASRIMVHGPEARRILVARFPAAGPKVVDIPHGHWVGRYPATLARADAREQLGLGEDAYVYLFVGLCKPYKNVDGLIEAFRRVSGADRALVIAGKFQDPAYEGRIRALAAEDPRVHVHAGYIPDDKLQLYLNGCDVVVAPYREILTSGSAILAASFGKPVISVDRGFLRDVVTPDTGLLFDVDDPTALGRALTSVAGRAFDAGRIREHVQRFRFEDAARNYANALGLDAR